MFIELEQKENRKYEVINMNNILKISITAEHQVRIDEEIETYFNIRFYGSVKDCFERTLSEKEWEKIKTKISKVK